ncbi:MAG TPA: purine-nucleoside phosphorylase, partial [Thermoleophilia bacterium]|nr:purine-nucleoside phosphorylase [Thermoleophilia bacterium]
GGAAARRPPGPPGGAAVTAALPRLDAAVVVGSGLAVVPDGVEVEAELGYAELGWPVSGVGGHASRLLVGRRDARRVGLAWGRPHLYEGWSRGELERPVRDLCAAGARHLVLTNSCGALRPSVAPGEAVVALEVVDLQEAPEVEPPRLAATEAARAAEVCAALAAHVPARSGVYVAVPGPQYETPAEVAWLATYGDVVGMSTAPEVRAARDCGAEVDLIALVVNRAAAVGEHGDVLAAAAAFATALRAVLGPLLDDAPAGPAATAPPPSHR